MIIADEDEKMRAMADLSKSHAGIILFLENYNKLESPLQAILVGQANTIQKLGDMHHGGCRSIVKFFWQRAACSCLDAMYNELKLMPRQGDVYIATRLSAFIRSEYVPNVEIQAIARSNARKKRGLHTKNSVKHLRRSPIWLTTTNQRRH